MNNLIYSIRLNLLLASCILLLLPGKIFSQEAVRHTVTAGETLYSISRSYDVTIPEIQQWNQLEGTLLSAGQELIIYTSRELSGEPRPEPAATSAAERGAERAQPRESIVSTPTPVNTYYTVRSGDYLNLIAREHGMSTEELRELNNLEGDLISVGQRLIVRASRNTPVVAEGLRESTPQGRFSSYRPERRESLEDILNRFSMTRDELEALNPGIESEAGIPGQITVLLPPNRTFPNPYRAEAGLQDLGTVPVTVYDARISAFTTTSGELYNASQLTAAHANIALGSVVFVENPDNGRGIHVKINDRFSGEGIKLSGKAFELLAYGSSGRPAAIIYQEE